MPRMNVSMNQEFCDPAMVNGPSPFEGGATTCLFRHDPYSRVLTQRPVCRSCASPAHPRSAHTSRTSTPPPFADIPPFGKHSEALEGRVTLFPLPNAEFVVPQTSCPRELMTKLFIGQLPYDVSDAMLTWAVFRATSGRGLFHVERIVRWKAGRQPSGCVHAYCFPGDADCIVGALKSRLLFDTIGVWCVTDASSQAALAAYCAELRARPSAERPIDIPCQPMTVERATSSYKLKAKHQKIVQREQVLRGRVDTTAAMPVTGDANNMQVWAPSGFVSNYFVVDQ